MNTPSMKGFLFGLITISMTYGIQQITMTTGDLIRGVVAVGLGVVLIWIREKIKDQGDK